MNTKKPKDFPFAKRASVYDDGFEGKAVRKFYNLLLREIELSPGALVLDAGCGTGALLKRIADTYEITGCGIDIEENMISEARSKCPQMSFSVADCDRMPFGDQIFDAVITCMAYHHFRNKEGFARETARVLKPGGMLYIADPRFPWPVRKAMNGVLRLVRIVGAFFKPEEIETRFIGMGFTAVGTAVDSYAQVVKLQRNQTEATGL